MDKKQEECVHAIGTDSCHDILYKMHEIKTITWNIEFFSFCPWCGNPIDEKELLDRIKENFDNLKVK